MIKAIDFRRLIIYPHHPKFSLISKISALCLFPNYFSSILFLGISFSLKRARVRIYRDVFRALGEPGCFRFLIDEETNRLAMQVCSFGDAGFHVAPDYYDKDPGWSFEITSLELLELIWEQCDWDPEGAYRITGILCRDINVVMFDLNDAEKYSGVEFAMV